MPDFYKTPNNPTVFTGTGTAFKTPEEFFSAGGAQDFSNVQTVDTLPFQTAQTLTGEPVNLPSVNIPQTLTAPQTTEAPQSSLTELFNQFREQAGLPALTSQRNEFQKTAFDILNRTRQALTKQEGGGVEQDISVTKQRELSRLAERELTPILQGLELTQQQIKEVNEAVKTQLDLVSEQRAFAMKEKESVLADKKLQSDIQKSIADAKQQGFSNELAIANAIRQIPKGQFIEIGGKRYEGIKTEDPDISTYKEEDAQGNVTIVGVDTKTGKILYKTSAGKIGKGFKSTSDKDGDTFTDTQFNKGAATAGISIDDFGRLDKDTQNFFINNSDQIKAKKKLIDEARASKDDPTSIEKEISESGLPDSVKDTLVRYLWSVFPRPEQKSLPWWKRIFR